MQQKIEALIEELQPAFGDRISSAAGICQQHGEDISHFPATPPDAVAFPESTEEVQQLVRACSRLEIPVIPFGVGTSLEGNILAVNGGVSVDLSRMNRILQVNEQDLDVTVQAGVTRVQLNQHLRDTGLFFPIDPGADATLGGMASTRASGTNAVRYGTMKENVLSLEVVLPDGRCITTSRRARKSSAGYDLTRLFVGSEGTLGIITEVTVRLYGLPEEMSSAWCVFPSVEEAVNAVIETIQFGIPVARIELMDEATVRAINAYSKTDFQEQPTLILEFHGSEVGARDQVEQFSDIAGAHGAEDFQWALRPEDRSRLWQARHDAAHAVAAFAPGTSQWWTDVCVPISRLAECITATQEDIASTGLVAPIVGHVGDGNFHVGICAPEDDPSLQQAADELHQRLVERALAMDGTCTGEHGIGLGKKEFLKTELGDAVDVMRLIKQALDPGRIMNPGKVFD
ncbi:MAG: FAD-linked oxidase C-terminal domain-containing protein [Xanthomonadales bacterium]|nr:FAD-linked oxidase C-terminal domain-containing protein [Xanthomonadales bacterium]